MNIEANVLNEIMSTIGSVSPETGGIIGTQNDVVCAYYFDRTGSCDSNTYKPDTVTVNSVISDWTQRSIQFAGIVHSHLEDRCELSCADIKYAQLIMTANDMNVILFPLVVIGSKVRVILYKVDRQQKSLVDLRCTRITCPRT